MNILFTLLIVAHVFVSIILVLLVLMQNDKGGGLAGAFGGMGGGAAFTGSSTATFMTKLTTGVAILSFALILGLNALSRSGGTAPVDSQLRSATQGMSSAIPEQYQGPGTFTGEAIPGLGAEPPVQQVPEAEPITPQ